VQVKKQPFSLPLPRPFTIKKTIEPSEIFRRDAWKAKGFTRLGLILIMTGIILLALYFVSL
jgi:hypothetical protein